MLKYFTKYISVSFLWIPYKLYVYIYAYKQVKWIFIASDHQMFFRIIKNNSIEIKYEKGMNKNDQIKY